MSSTRLDAARRHRDTAALAGLATAVLLALGAPAVAAGATPAPPDTAAPVATDSSPADAAPDLAYGAFQRGYYVTAMTEALKRLDTNPNDAPAMTLIGELYRNGLGVPPDQAKASHWYKLAADLGNREAIFALAVEYLQGQGVPQDKAMAKTLFEKAAAAGHAGALYNLGIMAIDADTPDFATAAKDFGAAADGGNMDAAYSLALLYRAGSGVEKDSAVAAHWMQRAADGRNVAAEVEYGIALFNGDGVARDESAAAKYLLRAAGASNPIAENRVARMLAAGRGVPVDLIEAMKWHLLAKAAGIQDAYLDGFLNKLTPDQTAQVQAAVAKFVNQ